MDLEALRSQALRIFDQQIIPHVIGDLDELDKIQPIDGKNACAVPTAMLILSTLEFIGYQLQEKAKLGESEKNIRYAIERGPFSSAYNETVISELSVIYRHGMMHSFYPSQRGNQIYGIHKSGNSDLFETFDKGELSIRSLNVNVLSNDFRAFISSLYDEVKTTSNQDFLKVFSSGYKNTYPENLTTSSTTTPQTTIPGGQVRDKR